MGKKKTARRRSHVNRKRQVSPTPDKGTIVQRTYKDSLFRFIFKDKQKLLKLYNALNGTDYRNIDRLTVTTIENVLYIGYKNDISFLLDETLNLYEHQGSWCPNMPLRGVLYFARLLQNYVEVSKHNLYGTKRISLPYPKYVIFYNGTAARPEREILRLSASYPESMSGSKGEPALECIAQVININYGQNREIMEQCRPLLDYATFIHYIRDSIAKGQDIRGAVDSAVGRCLKEDILADVLRANRKEVTVMFLEEYDQEQHYKTLRQEGYEEGHKEGTEDGLTLARKLLADNREEDIIRAATDRDFQKKLFKEYGL